MDRVKYCTVHIVSDKHIKADQIPLHDLLVVPRRNRHKCILRDNCNNAKNKATFLFGSFRAT